MSSLPSEVLAWLAAHRLTVLVEPLGDPDIGVGEVQDLRYVDVKDLIGCSKVALRRFEEAQKGECPACVDLFDGVQHSKLCTQVSDRLNRRSSAQPQVRSCLSNVCALTDHRVFLRCDRTFDTFSRLGCAEPSCPHGSR